jgi:hypothetical protein
MVEAIKKLILLSCDYLPKCVQIEHLKPLENKKVPANADNVCGGKGCRKNNFHLRFYYSTPGVENQE